VRIWLLRRLLLCVPTLVGLSLVTFLLSRLAPGGPFSSLLDSHSQARVSPQEIEAMQHLLGLDRPLPAQYLEWLRRFATLDFGTTLGIAPEPVAAKVGAALQVTFWLQLASVTLMLGIGVPLGVWCAARAGTRREKATGALLFLLHSAPLLLLGTLLMKLLCVGPLRLLPMIGLRSPDAPDHGLAGALDLVRHAALPVACIALAGLPGIARYARAGMLDELARPFMVAAAARGIPEWRRLFVHALRGGILPIVALLGQIVPFLVVGSVTVEKLFSLPGMGQLAADAILARDYPTVMAVSVVVGVAAMAGFLLADVVQALLDRRVRIA
jgi:peptide/nickel transport system permease protein